MPILKTFAVFAKYWEPGKVKTRLAESIGDSLAAEIYREFLVASLDLIGDRAEQKVIGFSPESEKEGFGRLASQWDLVPQVQSDLGVRMKCFFDEMFSRGPQHLSDNQTSGSTLSEHRVVLIGSDSPLIDPTWIDEAFERLANDDVVLGPSEDGGYYLLGARNRTPDIFQEIDWSTDQVLQQTVGQLKEKNYRFSQLPEHRDIDNLDDLQWMANELRKRDNGPTNRAALLELAIKALDVASEREAH